MRSVVRTGLVVLVAVFALSAVTAASAFAAPEWYTKTGGKFNKLTSALEVKTTGNLTVNDTGWEFGTSIKLSCKVRIDGTIEAGGLGKINDYLTGNCNIYVGNCENATAEAVNLPWKTELYSEGAKVRERLVSGGHGTPGWQFTCGGFISDRCNFNTSANMETKLPSGNVLVIFKKGESNKTTCTNGGENAGQLEGEITFPHPESVEAIAAGQVTSGEWRQGGASLKESTATTWKGTVKLTDTVGGDAVECEEAGAGSAGPGAVDTTTKVTLSKCVMKAGACEKPGLEARHLAWNTELIDYDGLTHDLTVSGGSGTPGYALTCNGFLTDTCEGTSNTAMENVTNGVDAKFDKEKLFCTYGGAGSGTLEGTQLIEATKGGKLEVK